jgi:hypothetical protein
VNFLPTKKNRGGQKLLVEEFSIPALSHIFIASASVNIADTYRNALYCDNCIYEKPQRYNHYYCFACYPVIHQSPGATQESGKYQRCTGGLWFSYGTIQSQKKEAEAKETTQGKKNQIETEPACLPEKESLGKLNS